MSFTITKTTTRPSAGVPAFKDSTGIDPAVATAIANIENSRRSNPAIQSRTFSVSADGLTRTSTTVWASKADHVAFNAANSIDIDKLDAAIAKYNIANGIVLSVTKSGA